MTPPHLRPVSSGAVLAWTGLGLLVVVAAFFAGFGATSLASQAGLAGDGSVPALRWDLAIGLAAFGLLGLIGLMVSNVPGALDGIEPESWLLSWLMAAAAAYMVGAASLAALVALRRRQGLARRLG